MFDRQYSGNTGQSAPPTQNLLDAIAAPIGLFLETGEINYANPALTRLVVEREWLWVVDRRLKSRGLSMERFDANVRELINGRAHQSSMVFKDTDKRRALLVGFNVIPDYPLALCHFVDPFETHSPRASELKALFGLTENESQVTAMIAIGLDYKEIAKDRQVSPETIRSYTKSIFRKIGVHSRANLVSVVQSATLPLRLVSREV